MQALLGSEGLPACTTLAFVEFRTGHSAQVRLQERGGESRELGVCIHQGPLEDAQPRTQHPGGEQR